MAPPGRSTGIIFDFDGTLADTIEDITDSINFAFERSGIEPVTPKLIRSLIGHGLSDLLRQALKSDGDEQLPSLVEGYRQVYMDRMLLNTHLYPGITELLDQCVAGGFPLAVLSNKPDIFTVPMCQKMLKRWPFVQFRGSSEDWPKKPDPTVALEFAREMKCDPVNVFFVGDSAVDIETARNAGMKSVAVTWGYRNLDELQAAQPDHIIDHPEELFMLAHHARSLNQE